MHRVWDSTGYSVSAWFNPHLLAAASSYPLKPHLPLSSYWGGLPRSQGCLSMCWLQLWAEGPFSKSRACHATVYFQTVVYHFVPSVPYFLWYIGIVVIFYYPLTAYSPD